jgi:hypothetical protein
MTTAIQKQLLAADAAARLAGMAYNLSHNRWSEPFLTVEGFRAAEREAFAASLRGQGEPSALDLYGREFVRTVDGVATEVHPGDVTR